MIDHSALKWGKARSGLLPVVIQDADTGRVLMLAYMNQEALQRTLETRKVTFFSRSRGQLWEKGETSGNTLQLVSIVADCDGDTILIKALPHGPTCHKGTVSCFAGAESGLESLGELVRIIRSRARSSVQGSYTRYLLEQGLQRQGAKLLEEAEEVFRAAAAEGPERTAEEAADLIYHLLVLLQGQEVELRQVCQVLRARRE